MIRTLIAAATLALLAASPVLAQTASGSMMASGYQMTKTDALASKVIGSPVYSSTALNSGSGSNTNAAPAGSSGNGTTATGANGGPASSANDTNAQQIGTVRDLIMGTDGKVSAVVIGIGGVLGIGEKNVAVSYGDVKWVIAQDGSIRGTLDTTADALKSAPDFQYPSNGQATNAGNQNDQNGQNGSGAGGNTSSNSSGMSTNSTGGAMTAPAAGAAMSTAMAPGASGDTAMQPVTDPQNFANMAAASNMFEIQSSQLAQKMATADNLKSFAQKMIADHTTAGQQMQTAAQTQKVTVPTALDPAHQQQLTQLQGMSGQQFDQAYIQMQIKAHDDAVALFQGYSQSGPAGALKDFAGKTLPTLQMHQAMIKQIAGK